MRLKTRKTESILTETDIELPIYLYFQDESCYDQYIKVDEDSVITVTYDWFGYTIEKSVLNKGEIQEHYLNSTCSKEEFDESLKNAIKDLK